MVAPPLSPAPPQLHRYAEITAAAIRDELSSGAIASPLAEPLADYPSRKGKGIRPGLLLGTCEAFGGLVADAIPSAVAIELLHNAFLIHDDIEDGSELRRGAPSLHQIHGVPMAIHAGDALALRAMGALRPNQNLLGGRLAAAVFDEFEFMSRQTANGQAVDLGWRRDNRLAITPEEYLELIMMKTGWYTTVLPLRVGALVGSRGKADIKPMIQFGFFLGAAFQIQDDILNLTGDPDLYGKRRYGDIIEAKRTLVLIHLMSVAAPDERRWLTDVLDPGHERSDDDVSAIVELMERYGSVGFAREFARGISLSALDSFEIAFDGVPAGSARSFIEAMVPYMVDRSS